MSKTKARINNNQILFFLYVGQACLIFFILIILNIVNKMNSNTHEHKYNVGYEEVIHYRVYKGPNINHKEKINISSRCILNYPICLIQECSYKAQEYDN